MTHKGGFFLISQFVLLSRIREKHFSRKGAKIFQEFILLFFAGFAALREAFLIMVSRF